MISIAKLNSYLQECQAAIAQIGINKLLADDSEFAEVVKEINTQATNVTLIGVIPSAYGSAKDEDSLMFTNKMLFFCVKKTDSKAGSQDYLDVFTVTQQAVEALILKLNTDQTTGNGLCNIGQFDFNTITIDPVRAYSGTNGWVLSIDLDTY